MGVIQIKDLNNTLNFQLQKRQCSVLSQYAVSGQTQIGRNITINGGTVTASTGTYAAAIGCGWKGSCGNILIRNTVTQVTATHGSKYGNSTPSSIGQGSVESDPNHPYSIGTITIEDGANVIQH